MDDVEALLEAPLAKSNDQSPGKTAHKADLGSPENVSRIWYFSKKAIFSPPN